MVVNVKAVGGRRDLVLRDFSEFLADAEMLVASPSTVTIGNWSLSHLINHLAATIDYSIDGFPGKAPWIVRMIAPWFKQRALTSKMSPGIKLPTSTLSWAYPDAASNQESLNHLRKAIARTSREPMLAVHPAFGSLTHEQWYQLHLRHGELHLSFARPN